MKSLNPDGLLQEILEEYLLTYGQLTDKIEWLDERIEELASGRTYHENVQTSLLYWCGDTYCFIRIGRSRGLQTLL